MSYTRTHIVGRLLHFKCDKRTRRTCRRSDGSDRAFSRLAQEKGVAEAFAAFVAPDGIRFVPGGQQRGPDIIKASMAKDFADGGKLAWAPIEGRHPPTDHRS
jgi:hypothetical protein